MCYLLLASFGGMTLVEGKLADWIFQVDESFSQRGDLCAVLPE